MIKKINSKVEHKRFKVFTEIQLVDLIRLRQGRAIPLIKKNRVRDFVHLFTMVHPIPIYTWYIIVVINIFELMN